MMEVISMIQYTEKTIQQTFQEMLTEMPFDKITVTADHEDHDQ